MNILKVFFAVLALSFSLNSLALTDDEQMEFTDGVTEGKIKVVEKFVKADVKVVNEKFFGWSPIQMASNKDQLAIVKYLLGKGADINYVHPVAHHTAFMLAALNGHEELAKYLAANGADVNVKLKGDVSLIRYFREEGNTHMVDFLTGLGVKDDGCKEERCF
ncbi:MAG: ankyrin repeat domain-containing protein [Methylotenera sp.]